MTLTSISPVDGSVRARRPSASVSELQASLQRARGAQAGWAAQSRSRRVEQVSTFVDAFVSQRDEIAHELTWQLGRPISQTPGEVRGFEERARSMMECSGHALRDIEPGDSPGFRRFIRRIPHGVVLVLAPWNYPYLTAVNAIVPALVAGNAVMLKHAEQTLLCAERLATAAERAGLQPGLLEVIHCDHATLGEFLRQGGVDHVSFTGSVAGGRAVQKACSDSFIGVGLELGGKDPAYVCSDAKLDDAVANLVDGAFFNSGQSCCGIERIYVADGCYADFVERFVALTRQYRMGNPFAAEVNLGPVVHERAAGFIRGQVAEAVAQGAKSLVPEDEFGVRALGPQYVAPQVLVNVDHRMRVMTEETFGPVIGIMKVGSDDEAVRLMNDSRYGLTASVWTQDEERAIALGDRLETGTCFMNRCDYLDPKLAWTGVKDSGRGCSLSELGFAALTRPKSFHLKRG